VAFEGHSWIDIWWWVWGWMPFPGLNGSGGGNANGVALAITQEPECHQGISYREGNLDRKS
jgi:hypothetical protein